MKIKTGFEIYRKIEDITERFVIKGEKTWFETQLKDYAPKKSAAKRFLLNTDKQLELIQKGYTTIVSYVVENIQNGELTLWADDNYPGYMQLTYLIFSDYKLEKCFEEKIRPINKWSVDIRKDGIIAKKDDYVYTVNLRNGEIVLRKDETTQYIKHYNILNFNEIHFTFNEDDVELSYETIYEETTVPTE